MHGKSPQSWEGPCQHAVSYITGSLKMRSAGDGVLINSQIMLGQLCLMIQGGR